MTYSPSNEKSALTRKLRETHYCLKGVSTRFASFGRSHHPQEELCGLQRFRSWMFAKSWISHRKPKQTAWSWSASKTKIRKALQSLMAKANQLHRYLSNQKSPNRSIIFQWTITRWPKTKTLSVNTEIHQKINIRSTSQISYFQSRYRESRSKTLIEAIHATAHEFDLMDRQNREEDESRYRDMK